MIKDFVLRLLIFSSFAAATHYFIFTPGPTNSASINPTIYAANAGYPFYEYPTEVEDPLALDKTQLTRLENNDYGLSIVVSFVSVAGRYFNKDFLITPKFVGWIVQSIILISCLLLVFSPLPVIINLLAVITLFLVTLEVAPSFLNSDVGNVRWLVSICPVIILNLVFVYFYRLQKGERFFRLIFFIYAIWLAVFGVIRQDAAIFVYLFILFLFVFSISIYTSLSGGAVNVLHKKNFGLAALFLITPLIFNLLVKVSLTLAYDRPLTKIVGMPRHGSGVPLYLGLGASNNPFNIAWQDEVAELHAPFYYQGEEHQSLQPILGGAWRKIILREPGVFLGGLFDKALQLHKIFMGSEISVKDRAFFMSGLEINKYFWIYYLLFLGFSAFLLGYLIFAESNQVKIFLLSSYVVALGGFVSPVLVYPGYPVSAMGSIVAICGWLLPLFFLKPFFDIDFLEDMVLKPIVSTFKYTFGSVVALGVIWISATSLINKENIKTIISGEPLSLIHQMKFEYGHYFNRLNEDQKWAIVYSLKAKINEGVFVNEQKSDTGLSVFKPMAAVIDDENNQFHLIVFLGKKWQLNVNEIDQGKVNSRIAVAVSEDELGYRKDIDLNKHLFIDIADREWKDQVRFLSFPLGEGFDRKAAKLFIKGYQRTALDATQPGGVAVSELGMVELSAH